MKKKITVLAVMIVLQTMVLGLVTVDALIEKQSVTVTKEWNDKEDHSNDVVTVQLLANGIPATDKNGDKIEAVLTSEKSTYTFTDLPFYQIGEDPEAAKPITYGVRETKINGEDVDQLVSEGKYKKPKIKEASEETKGSKITYQRYVQGYPLKDGGKYAIVICNYRDEEGHYRDQNVYSTIDSAMNVTDVEYRYDKFDADNGVTYWNYVENITDESLWTVSYNNDDTYTFSNGNKKLALRDNQDGTYEYVVTEKDNDSNENTHLEIGNPYVRSKVNNSGNLYMVNAGNGTFKAVAGANYWNVDNSRASFIEKVDVSEDVQTTHSCVRIMV